MKNYGAFTGHLIAMLPKNAFTWTSEAIAAFQKLEQVMSQTPVLALLDFSQTSIAKCDASNYDQSSSTRRAKPIAYFDCALAVHYHCLSAYERELIGLPKGI